jgi:glycosyltransferase involved in cell wall biosynthesis
MKLTVVTDTWDNVNGVVTTLRATVQEMQQRGYEVQVIEPGLFRTIPMPGYPEVRLAWDIWKTGRLIEDFNPDFIHIATEGPLGIAARWYCKVRHRKIPHNTSYHTKFPEYLKIHHGIPVRVGYFFMRVFHKFSHRVLVTTATMEQELRRKGFNNLVIWSRGVDHNTFNTSHRKPTLAGKPVLLCVSRASPEKGLDDFCSIKTPGTKILVGDGPYLETLKSKYPDVIFAGYKKGSSLAHYYANADVFIFPSRSDTFGVVMLESMACGTPVAAYPVTGPIDIITPGVDGCMDDDLSKAIHACLGLDRKMVEESSRRFTWKACTDVFEKNLVSARSNK